MFSDKCLWEEYLRKINLEKDCDRVGAEKITMVMIRLIIFLGSPAMDYHGPYWAIEVETSELTGNIEHERCQESRSESPIENFKLIYLFVSGSSN